MSISNPFTRNVVCNSNMLGLQLHHRLLLARPPHSLHAHRGFLLVRLLESVRLGVLLLPAA